MMSDQFDIKPYFKPTRPDHIPCDWDVKYFEEIADIDKESLGSNTPKDYSFDYISLSDVDGEEFKSETTRQEFGSAPSRARRVVREGDILMATVRPNLQGFTIIKKTVKDLIASTGFAVIRTTKCSNEFLYYYIFSSAISKQFYQLLVGSNYPAINSSDVKRLKALLPPLPEQRAIAACLSTWDNAITKVQALLAQKELRKKWLMQQLLTGKRRLKGHEERWKEIVIGDHFEFIRSYSISRDGLDKSEVKNRIYCIHYGDIHAFYETDFLDFSKQRGIPQIVDEMYKTSIDDCLIDGDVIIADASEDYEGVAEAVTVINVNDKIAVGGLHTIVLRGDPNVVSNEYRGYLFSSESVRNKLRKLATGTSVYSVSRATLEKLIVIIPVSLEEQRSISLVLLKADNEIQLLKKKIEKLKEQKKGMMQVLLTGKIRLKTNN